MSAAIPRELPAAGGLAVRTRGLVKRYGGRAALAGVDLSVPEGSVYVLVGPNGVGKTTTLKVLLDLVRADEGTAEVLRLDPVKDGARVRGQVGYVPERQDQSYPWIRVGDLLRHHAGYYPTWDAGYEEELVRALEVRRDARFGKLSKGEARRVQLVLALAHHPPLLLMDEPTDGLDPVMREEAVALLAEHLARFPTTVVVSTHLVHEAEGLGDHLAVMRGGRIDVQLDRETLRLRLRKYWLDVPDGWSGAPALEANVVRRAGLRREPAWTVWGDEAEVLERLRGAGATVREVESITLSEAAVALLSRRVNGAAMVPGGSRNTTLAGA